jgi:hypothetical protein
MAQSTRTRPTHSVLPARPPLLTPHPPSAPLLPPLHVVDLMTAEGSAAFAATWRVREAKLVECPALGDAMPEFPTTYDIEPHAEESGFDDSDWTVVPATDLGGRPRRRHGVVLLVPRDLGGPGQRFGVRHRGSNGGTAGQRR